MADEYRWASGPVVGKELLSEIMLFISSASFTASLYSLTHGSPEDAIYLLMIVSVVSHT